MKPKALICGIAVMVTVNMTGPASAAPSAFSLSVTPVLSHLNAARGIAFDGQGSLYVAESGQALPGPAGVTRTGRVSKYAAGSFARRWSTSFTSLHDSEHGTPEALGPEGISAVGSGCMGNGHGQRNGCQIQMIMSESQAGTAGVDPDSQLGHLYRLDGATGTPTDKSDVGGQQYQWTTDHRDLFPSDFPDSNPYGLLVTKGHGGLRTFVADAGANTISEVTRDGTTRVLAYLPNETNAGQHDATPTCVTEGPDGALYVGTLDLLSNFSEGGGQSHVYRIDPNVGENYLTAAHEWAHGLTSISACTFDRAGNFWGTELFGQTTHGAPGDLVRIPFGQPASVTHLGAGQIILPGGIAQGPDGAMYVTTHTADPTPNASQVVRVSTTG